MSPQVGTVRSDHSSTTNRAQAWYRLPSVSTPLMCVVFMQVDQTQQSCWSGLTTYCAL